MTVLHIVHCLIIYIAYNITILSASHLGVQYVLTNIDKHISKLIQEKIQFLSNWGYEASVLVPFFAMIHQKYNCTKLYLPFDSTGFSFTI